MKKQTYDLGERLLDYSVRIIKVVEDSMFGVRCSVLVLNVHLGFITSFERYSTLNNASIAKIASDSIRKIGLLWLF